MFAENPFEIKKKLHCQWKYTSFLILKVKSMDGLITQ
jgi:hypothetical protein